jgi:adenylate kinase
MLNIILFGPPGSGKGTQSEKLTQKYGLIHLSTGDLLRREINAQTALGMEAKKLMDKGELVPDKVVIDIISSAFMANMAAKGFLFDGFPRTEAQAIALDALLAVIDTEIALVLSLEVGEEELVKRLLLRGVTSSRSDDNNEEVIRARIVEYHKKTSAVAGYYRQFNKVVAIDGEGTVDEIFTLLCEEIDKKLLEI